MDDTNHLEDKDSTHGPSNPPTYAPPAAAWVREQLEQIDAAGGDTAAVDIQGLPVVVLTMRGRRSGALRRVPLMRVEHEGVYAAVASKGGAPDHPEWYFNLVADPAVDLHDGTTHTPTRAREIDGQERTRWWARCVEAFPQYADYQRGTDRQIPVFLLEPVTHSS
ncbi:MAG: nitroreductase family deazaflavin-dependent oxidoreductase [Ornithinimicrobium sp.]